MCLCVCVRARAVDFIRGCWNCGDGSRPIPCHCWQPRRSLRSWAAAATALGRMSMVEAPLVLTLFIQPITEAESNKPYNLTTTLNQSFYGWKGITLDGPAPLPNTPFFLTLFILLIRTVVWDRMMFVYFFSSLLQFVISIEYTNFLKFVVVFVPFCSRLGTECPVEQTTTATLVLSQPNVPSSANQPIRRYNGNLENYYYPLVQTITSSPFQRSPQNKESIIVPCPISFLPYFIFYYLFILFSFFSFGILLWSSYL